jgi:uncharacterized protein YndB with AHSA1/START domain
MHQIHVLAGRQIAAPSHDVYRAIADYNQRPRWLPPAFSNPRVEEGGVGKGTVVNYHLKVGPRERDYRMRVVDEWPGSELEEQDLGSSLINHWSASPRGTGTLVRVDTTWEGARGIGGFFERLFAPRALRSVYDDMLARLDQYVHSNQTGSNE